MCFTDDGIVFLRAPKWLDAHRLPPCMPIAQLKAMYEQSLKLNGGRLVVHGIFARADTRNNNRRVYPMNVLKREAARFDRERIESGTALGEVDHPSYNSQYFRCINLANISHQVSNGASG